MKPAVGSSHHILIIISNLEWILRNVANEQILVLVLYSNIFSSTQHNNGELISH